jgi:hypothetical protein
VQIFGPAANSLLRIAMVGVVAVPLVAASALIVLARSEYVTGANRAPQQPVPFSHSHHAAEIGIDCRYCHTGVETSATAGIPPTSTCMTCHSEIWTNAAMLAPVRESFAQGTRLRWTQVNELPDYVYFDHSAHVANGVACTTCHGPVGEMRLIRQEAPLTMGWCLSCHRDPRPNLSPPTMIFSPFPSDTRASAEEISAWLGHSEALHLTDCSVCHR